MSRTGYALLSLLVAGLSSVGCSDASNKNVSGEPLGLGGESTASGGRTAGSGGATNVPGDSSTTGGTSSGGSTAGGGNSSGGSSSGGSSSVDPDDPCGVVGTWKNGCPVAPLCGSCEGSLNLAYEFDIPADIAKYGGQFLVDGALLTFTTSTCTLSVSANYCTPWTEDVFVLQNGTGNGTGHAHCRDESALCECATAVSCSPVRK